MPLAEVPIGCHNRLSRMVYPTLFTLLLTVAALCAPLACTATSLVCAHGGTYVSAVESCDLRSAGPRLAKATESTFARRLARPDSETTRVDPTLWSTASVTACLAAAPPPVSQA